MIYYQQWEIDTFEYEFLNKIKKCIKKEPNQKMYMGFDCGFFSGMNIYYGSKYQDYLANKIYKALKKEKIRIRLCTNIDYDFELILLFGFINKDKEKKYLQKKQKKIMKVLSKLI